MTVGVRDAVPAERAAVHRVCAAAFGAEEGPVIVALVDLLDSTGATRAALVAETEGRLVGHVQLSRGWVDAERELVEVLVLAPLSVAPEAQRRGVGTALLAAAVERAEELGAPAVFLEGDPGYYGGRGFEPAEAWGFARPSVRIPEPAFQVRVLAAYEPWMTGALVYADAFWQLDCVGLRGRG